MKEVIKRFIQNGFHDRIKMERWKKNLGGWIVMLPSIVLFAFFIWVPLISNIELSFYDTIGYTKDQFVGLNNYFAIFNDPRFMTALGNTFQYVFYSIIIGFIVPIFIGLLLSEVVHFKTFFRTSIYLPSIISGMAIAILWTFVFDPNQGSMLNSILRSFGMEPFLWLDSEAWSIPLIVLTMTWRGAGGTVLIYLSALQNIDTNYYEAARLEGASLWQRIWYITLPSIKSTIRVLFILQIISVLQVFYEPMVMTDKGGPNNASLSLMLLSYIYAFDDDLPALGAAVGVILALIIIALTLVYLKVVKRNEKES